VNAIREWIARVVGLVLRRNRRIEDELRTHRDLLIDELRASGMTVAEARHAAGAKLGSLSAAANAYRDQSGLPALDSWACDLRYSMRSLHRTPAAAVSMVLVLGLGIGVSTAVATALHALVWQPLPVPGSEHLVKLGAEFSGRFSRHVQGSEWFVSLPELDTYRQRVHALISVAGVDEESLIWQHDGDARSVQAALVTTDYFTLLQVRPVMGRLLSARDSDAPMTVVSYRFWADDLAGDPAVVGRSLVLGRTAYMIVGVMERTFSGTESEPVDIWLPLVAAVRARGDAAALTEPDLSWLQFIGRLAPGASLASATAEANAIAAGLDRDHHPGRRMRMVVTRASRLALGSFQSHDRGTLIAGGTAAVLLIVVLLLICGSNVAALQLARGAAREKEFAVRIALGAGRGRLAQSIVAELSVIATASALAGVAIAAGLLGILQRWLPLREVVGTLTPDLRMLTFGIAYALLVTIGFGLAPVRQALRLDCLAGLKGMPGPMPAWRLRRILNAAQIAVSLALLSVSAWAGRGAEHAFRVSLGYSPTSLFIVQPDRASVPGGTPADLARFVDRLQDALRSTPGISAVGRTLIAPFWGSGTTHVRIDGGSEPVPVSFSEADETYFRALGVTALVGSIPHPTEADAILVNAAFARRFWGTDAGALGHVVEVPDAVTRHPRQIVGVIPEIHTISVGQPDPPICYLPAVPNTETMQNLVVRAAGATPVPRLVSAATGLIAPGTFVRVVPVTERIHGQLTPAIMGATIAALIGVLSLIVAAVGIHGIVSHAVTTGTRDIGIRLALGASRIRVLGSVIGPNLRSAAVGAVTCALALMVCSLSASSAFRSVFLGLDPADPTPFLTAVLVLGVVVCGAAYVPAQRALGVDPIDSLRRE
jgi:predicted permease